MCPADERFTAQVGERELTFSNLQKVLYPATGFTKGEVIDYYLRIAPVMLPHLCGRPITSRRFPNGVDQQGFIEKNIPRHAPEWIRTAILARKEKGRDTNQYALIDDLPGLVFFANLAAIEFHTPMWRVGDEAIDDPDDPINSRAASPDLIVFDLDPGTPASIEQCCIVALLLKDRLAGDDIELYPKTSGSKGMQLYGSVAARKWQGLEVNSYAHAAAESLETECPQLVVSRMAKSLRSGKILIDWSQNNPAKTTVSPYSMRAVTEPRVSTPLTWDEVEAGSQGAPLVFTPTDVLARVEEMGDIFAPVLGLGASS